MHCAHPRPQGCPQALLAPPAPAFSWRCLLPELRPAQGGEKVAMRSHTQPGPTPSLSPPAFTAETAVSLSLLTMTLKARRRAAPEVWPTALEPAYLEFLLPLPVLAADLGPWELWASVFSSAKWGCKMVLPYYLHYHRRWVK